jgi:hypothetical protein
MCYSSVSNSIRCYSALFYSILLYFILFKSIPFSSIFLCFIPFSATLPHSVLLYSTCPFTALPHMTYCAQAQFHPHLLLAVSQQIPHLLWNLEIQHWPSSNKPAANPSSRVMWIPSPLPWMLHTESIPSSLITIFNKQGRSLSSPLSITEETAQWCIQSTHNCEDNRTKNEDQIRMAMQTRCPSGTTPHHTTPHHTTPHHTTPHHTTPHTTPHHTTPHHTTPHHTTPRFASNPTSYIKPTMKSWKSHELISRRRQIFYSCCM